MTTVNRTYTVVWEPSEATARHTGLFREGDGNFVPDRDKLARQVRQRLAVRINDTSFDANTPRNLGSFSLNVEVADLDQNFLELFVPMAPMRVPTDLDAIRGGRVKGLTDITFDSSAIGLTNHTLLKAVNQAIRDLDDLRPRTDDGTLVVYVSVNHREPTPEGPFPFFYGASMEQVTERTNFTIRLERVQDYALRQIPLLEGRHQEDQRALTSLPLKSILRHAALPTLTFVFGYALHAYIQASAEKEEV